MEKDLKYWAGIAKTSQTACNLSGVVHSFSDFMTWLRKTYPNKDTSWYNTHNISLIFAQSINNITGVDSDIKYIDAIDELEAILHS